MTNEEKANKPENIAIFERKCAEFDRVRGPRVGDFIRLPRFHKRHPEFTRITHDWGDTLQTGGTATGSYYHAGNCLSYSGGLDIGIAALQLIPTGETRLGSIWFFDEGRSGAGRAVYFDAPMRVFNIKPGADLSGLDELRCAFFVWCHTEEQKQERGYYFTASGKFGRGGTASNSPEEIAQWLAKEELILNEPLQFKPPHCVQLSTHYADDRRFTAKPH